MNLNNQNINNKNLKIILYVFIIASVFITSLNISEYLLKNKIQKSELAYNTQQITSLLKNIKYNNNILESKKIISFNNKKYLLYTAEYNNTPHAIIVNTTTADGYNGNINILVAIKLKEQNINKNINNTFNKILDIKILQHNETPGLGDLIEPEKSSWLLQFKNKYLSPNNNTWGLKKDLKNIKNNNNNNFDSLTGATITSRAVSNAIKDSLELVNNYIKNKDAKN